MGEPSRQHSWAGELLHVEVVGIELNSAAADRLDHLDVFRWERCEELGRLAEILETVDDESGLAVVGFGDVLTAGPVDFELNWWLVVVVQDNGVCVDGEGEIEDVVKELCWEVLDALGKCALSHDGGDLRSVW